MCWSRPCSVRRSHWPPPPPPPHSGGRAARHATYCWATRRSLLPTCSTSPRSVNQLFFIYLILPVWKFSVMYSVPLGAGYVKLHEWSRCEGKFIEVDWCEHNRPRSPWWRRGRLRMVMETRPPQPPTCPQTSPACAQGEWVCQPWILIGIITVVGNSWQLRILHM